MLRHDRPDEPSQLAGYGNGSLLWRLTVSNRPVFLVKTMLSEYTMCDNFSRLSLLPSLEVLAQVRFACVLVCRFNQNSPAMSVASFSDRSLSLRSATAVFGWHHTKIRHQFRRRWET